MVREGENLDRQASVRQAQFEIAQRQYREEQAAAAEKGRLAVRNPQPEPEETPVQAEITVPAEAPAEPVDPGAQMRHLRMGIVGAIFLTFLVIWVIQGKRAARK